MSFGVDTVVETYGRKIAAKIPALGHNAYNLAIFPSLAKSIRYHISYDLKCVDGKTGEEYSLKEDNKEYTLMAICNASYYGGGYCPAPNSVLDDGLVDACIISGLSIAEAIPLIPKYSKGLIDEGSCDKCTNAFVKSGKIWMNDGSPLLGNCDGENFHYSELDFFVQEKALKLCIIK